MLENGNKIDVKPYFKHLATVCVFLHLFSNTANLYGQEKNVSNTNQQWIQYYGKLSLASNWTLLYDGGHRWRNGFEETSQNIARIGMGYSFNPDVRVSVGIANLGFYSHGSLNRIETRPYQEILLKRKIEKVSVSHRYRIEERFFNAVNDGGEAPNSFNFRFRYSIMLGIPLFKLSQKKEKKVFLLNIGNELFLNAGEDIVNNVFNQNRVIVSPTIKVNEKLSISFTWNYQFAGTTTPGEFINSQIAWLQIKHKSYWTNKKREE